MKRTKDNTIIIGIDHGYGNMKTANRCFPTGILAYDSEPLFTKNLLVFENKYYLIGEGHKEFLGNKVVCQSLPIRPGRNIAAICEVAAVNHRQKKMGYNAAEELYRRVQDNTDKE